MSPTSRMRTPWAVSSSGAQNRNPEGQLSHLPRTSLIPYCVLAPRPSLLIRKFVPALDVTRMSFDRSSHCAPLMVLLLSSSVGKQRRNWSSAALTGKTRVPPESTSFNHFLCRWRNSPVDAARDLLVELHRKGHSHVPLVIDVRVDERGERDVRVLGHGDHRLFCRRCRARPCPGFQRAPRTRIAFNSAFASPDVRARVDCERRR